MIDRSLLPRASTIYTFPYEEITNSLPSVFTISSSSTPLTCTFVVEKAGVPALEETRETGVIRGIGIIGKTSGEAPGVSGSTASEIDERYLLISSYDEKLLKAPATEDRLAPGDT
jgi:hypothetical protein